MNGKNNMWIDYKNYKHFDLLEQLRDIALSEYDNKLNPHLVAESIKERYNQLPWPPKVDWHLHPLIMNTEINKDFSAYWPASTEFASKIPGLRSLNVNYVSPNTIIPDHKDDILELKQLESWRKKLGIVTMIGIDMPSNDVDVVGFHVNNIKKSWSSGDIVSFDGHQLHGGWNNSDKMRVTFYISIDKEYYDTI